MTLQVSWVPVPKLCARLWQVEWDLFSLCGAGWEKGETEAGQRMTLLPQPSQLQLGTHRPLESRQGYIGYLVIIRLYRIFGD